MAKSISVVKIWSVLSIAAGFTYGAGLIIGLNMSDFPLIGGTFFASAVSLTLMAFWSPSDQARN